MRLPTEIRLNVLFARQASARTAAHQALPCRTVRCKHRSFERHTRGRALISETHLTAASILKHMVSNAHSDKVRDMSAHHTKSCLRSTYANITTLSLQERAHKPATPRKLQPSLPRSSAKGSAHPTKIHSTSAASRPSLGTPRVQRALRA